MVTTMAFGMTCDIEKTVNCTPITQLKCKRITYNEIQQEPHEECKDFYFWIPIQKKEHKKKCILPDISTKLPSEKPNEIQAKKKDLKYKPVSMYRGGRSSKINQAIAWPFV